MHSHRQRIKITALVWMLIASMLASTLPALAAGSAVLKVSSINNCQTGDAVVIPVTISANSGACMVQFTLNYDADQLMLEDAAAGTALNAPTINSQNPCYIGFAWDNTTPATAAGSVLELTFTVLAEDGETAVIDLDETEDFIFYDYDFNEIDVQFDTGYIRVSSFVDMTTYSFSDGVLTISGTGAMSDYFGGDTPWDSYKDQITSVIIEPGVTKIGSNAFAGCTNLNNVTIASTVTGIGSNAFAGCTGLSDVFYEGAGSAWSETNPAGSGHDELDNATVYSEEDMGTFTSTVSGDGTRVTISGEGMLPLGDWGDLTEKIVMLDNRVTGMTERAILSLKKAEAILIIPTGDENGYGALLHQLLEMGLDQTRVLGDADIDGITMATDISRVCRHCIKKITLDPATVNAVDVDRNGHVNVIDAHLMADYIVGRMLVFPES